MIHILEELCAKVSQMLDDKILAAKTITLKLKYSNFELITRSSTQSYPIADAADLLTAVIPLIEKTELWFAVGASGGSFGFKPDRAFCTD